MSTSPKPLTPPPSGRTITVPRGKSASRTGEAAGGFVTLDGEAYYRISAYHRMPPFLMSLATDTDLWMFVTSSGGLTAGRVDAEGSLFPYETVDKLYDAHRHTGPVTLIRARRADGAAVLWQPFSDETADVAFVERSLYKNVTGNRVVFEETHRELDLVFRYRWAGSDDLGWVRTATLENRGSAPAAVSLLDGVRNILPYGAPLSLYQQSSCLVDAYKRTDCDSDTGLAIYSLTSRIVDRAEASEVLRANTAWSHGLDRFDVRLSEEAITAFRRGEVVPVVNPLTGRRGHYLVLSSMELPPGDSARWHIAADAGRSHVQVAALRAQLLAGAGIEDAVERSLAEANENLLRIVGRADGFHLTGRPEDGAHHFANVLFNCMRGGVFAHDHHVPRDDFLEFLGTRNRSAAERHAERFRALPDDLPLDLLHQAARDSGDPDLERLALEYLPLFFGRRHGDPSRPWNRFSIRVRDAAGNRALRYEGNWRDIFQNWEALGWSYPGFLPHFIATFVNASTVDGFNPYRITRDGVDWEIVDPDDPWSYIGYWGDHQIVYLMKFLEALPRFAPGGLEDLLDREIFAYADVPYRIKPFGDILRNPHATIDYESARATRVEARVRARGADGKLVTRSDGSVHHATLWEKLLVPALSKLSNLVPDAGIWMNTQRPEWNDANNALVGYGVSMVTLLYLRRYLDRLARLAEERVAAGGDTAVLSREVARWFGELAAILEEHRRLLDAPALNDRDRMMLLDALGRAFTEYREAVYDAGFSGKTTVQVPSIAAFCRLALEYLDHAIRANRRDDGLYHAYNLIDISTDREAVAVRPLYEMLEGQVAALSSGLVDAEEAVGLLAALFTSSLYREDQRSFMLYPERTLPSFLEKNVVSDESVAAVPLLSRLLEEGETSIVERDAAGVCRFNGDFHNAGDLAAAMDRLGARDEWTEFVAHDRTAVLEVFEKAFDHHSFTGRSGTMYAYEGLGSIYWHMVAKLLLAVQEVYAGAVGEDRPAAIRDELARYYFRIRAGLGYEKSPAEYGAFPTDPYSHTPAHGGAKQPGMTGQVKEEILTRFGELGVKVENGELAFRPLLLRRGEFRERPGVFRFYDADGVRRTLEVTAGTLVFSFCGVPVVYHLSRDAAWVRVTGTDGASTMIDGDTLDAEVSRPVFARRGSIQRIDVGVPQRSLCGV